MKIITYESYLEMSQSAADIIEHQIKEKPSSVIGLATGSTPEGLYKILCEKYSRGEISFSEATAFNLDEYCGIPPENPQSYKHFMDTHLFNKTNFNRARLFIPHTVNSDYQKICTEYDEEIKSAGGIDLQLLGIGINGHVGFNEPADFFTKETHVVSLSDDTIEANSRFFEDKSDVPTEAITMGMYAIMTAKKVLLVINGEKKREIFEAATTGKITPLIPASLLQLHPNVTVLYSKE